MNYKPLLLRDVARSDCHNAALHSVPVLGATGGSPALGLENDDICNLEEKSPELRQVPWSMREL